MSEITYRIWFTPAVNGAPQALPAPDYEFHERAAAETVADHLGTVNNPCWNGVYSVVEQIGGRPRA